MKKLFVLAAALLANVALAAQGDETGKVSSIVVHHASPDTGAADQRVIFKLDGTKKGGLCGSDPKEEWLIYLDSEASKAQYAAVLAAYISDNKIRAHGNFTAECYLGGEIVRNILLVK